MHDAGGKWGLPSTSPPYQLEIIKFPPQFNLIEMNEKFLSQDSPDKKRPVICPICEWCYLCSLNFFGSTKNIYFFTPLHPMGSHHSGRIWDEIQSCLRGEEWFTRKIRPRQNSPAAIAHFVPNLHQITRTGYEYPMTPTPDESFSDCRSWLSR